MRLRTLLIVAVVLLAVAGLGVYLALDRQLPRLPSAVSRACDVRTPDGEVTLNYEQMANAATIAAVGLVRKVPDRGIVVALATSLQESRLENLAGGDRDSIGLFQQRPSQGWGKPEQISDPRYAATRFYAALKRVKNWQGMRVTEAAQRVQRSAFPEAYEKWAEDAQVLTDALTGHAPGAVSCTGLAEEEPARRGALAAELLDEGLRLDWGTVTTVEQPGLLGVALQAVDDKVGWQFAHWLVAHSAGTGVQRVRFGDREWTADHGDWRAVDAIGSGPHVVAEVFGGP